MARLYQVRKGYVVHFPGKDPLWPGDQIETDSPDKLKGQLHKVEDVTPPPYAEPRRTSEAVAKAVGKSKAKKATKSKTKASA